MSAQPTPGTTPRPWQMYRYSHGSGRIHKDERTLIADVHGPEANREFVFRAVNDYDRLRGLEMAAREYVTAAQAFRDNPPPDNSHELLNWAAAEDRLWSALRAALARPAEEERG